MKKSKQTTVFERPRLAAWVSVVLLAILFSDRAPAGEVSGRVVKNIIIMIGDGMGYNQVGATEMYDKGTTGTEVFDQFPCHFAMSTFPVGGSYDPVQAWGNFSYVLGGYTDSAAAATAMSTGQKTYNTAIGWIGTSAANAMPGKHTVEYAKERGMSTGVVTTVMFYDATPAGFSAHTASRYATPTLEMLTTSTLDVIMGTGHPYYNDNNQPNGASGSDWIWEALRAKTLPVADADRNGIADDDWTLIDAKTQFEDLATTTTPPKRLLGIPRVSQTLQWYRTDERGYGPALYQDDPPGKVPFNTGVPTLATMARGALNVLHQNPKGFFVMIEGGAIDWACHNHHYGRLIEETQDFDRAIEAVVDWVNQNSNWEETMLVVTADHENGHIWGPGSSPAFAPLLNNGVGKMPEFYYYGTYHTNALVPVYLKCSPAVGYLFLQRATHLDPMRGPYIDNTDLGQLFIGMITGALGKACSPLINGY